MPRVPTPAQPSDLHPPTSIVTHENGVRGASAGQVAGGHSEKRVDAAGPAWDRVSPVVPGVSDAVSVPL